MTKIYLIRHAEAEGNLYRRIQGHSDSDVTARGRRQIDALAERFRDIPIDAVYCSDLRRTRLTAGAITRYHDLPLNVRPELREVALGAWENEPWGNIQHDEPQMLKNFSAAPDKWSVPGGESFEHLKARLVGAVTRIARENDGKTVAVVSHGMALRALLFAISGIPLSEIGSMGHADNTSVSLVTYDNGAFTVEYMYDNSHLTDDLSTFATQTWWKSESGGESNNLRFIPLDLERDRELYCRCYADSWIAAHGSLDGFSPEPYWASAKKHAAAVPESLVKAFSGPAFAGIVELDMKRDARKNAGWISLFYIVPEYRGRRFAQQLLGHAIQVFRPLGRRYLHLHVADSNKNAIDFYEHLEFQKIGEARSATGKLFLMEKDISIK